MEPKMEDQRERVIRSRNEARQSMYFALLRVKDNPMEEWQFEENYERTGIINTICLLKNMMQNFKNYAIFKI